MRRFGVLGILLIVVACPTAAVSVGGSLLAIASSMSYVNEIIGTYEDSAGVEVGSLHTGLGACIDVGLVDVIGAIDGVLAIRSGSVSIHDETREENVEIEAGFLGVAVGASTEWGPVEVTADAGIYRGTFEFAAVRYVGLTGWAPGASIGVQYTLALSRQLSAGVGAQLQWVAFYQMKDSSGQTFRARGTPFVDFTGLCVSIGLEWTL